MHKSRHSKLGIAVALTLFSVCLAGCFKLSSDAGALRDSVIRSTATGWDAQIEVGVGAVTLGLARAGLAFVDLEPDARCALNAVRSAEVGAYKRRGDKKQLQRSAILKAADRAMTERGWDRIVAVINRRELVAVYAPRKAYSTRDFKVCLVTVNDDEFVVASARSNLGALMEMAFQHVDRDPKGRSPL